MRITHVEGAMVGAAALPVVSLKVSKSFHAKFWSCGSGEANTFLD